MQGRGDASRRRTEEGTRVSWSICEHKTEGLLRGLRPQVPGEGLGEAHLRFHVLWLCGTMQQPLNAFSAQKKIPFVFCWYKEHQERAGPRG